MATTECRGSIVKGLPLHDTLGGSIAATVDGVAMVSLPSRHRDDTITIHPRCLHDTSPESAFPLVKLRLLGCLALDSLFSKSQRHLRGHANCEAQAAGLLTAIAFRTVFEAFCSLGLGFRDDTLNATPMVQACVGNNRIRRFLQQSLQLLFAWDGAIEKRFWLPQGNAAKRQVAPNRGAIGLYHSTTGIVTVFERSSNAFD